MRELGVHRKLVIPPGFETDRFMRAKGCQLCTYQGLRIATLICYDAEFPDTAHHAAAADGEALVL